MKNLEKLVSGYKRFLNAEFKNHESRYQNLAENGQSPKIMVIGCSDSRVNPDLIFNTKPGDIFVVRNVANLVPPYENDGSYHGTSAALEFAVTGLNVDHIVIMGHSLCGGVKACCDSVQGQEINGEFIEKWTSFLKESAQKVKENNKNIDNNEFHRLVEMEGIRASINNLKAFPFIDKAIKENTLILHGVYFNVGSAQLYALDRVTNDFIAIE